MVPFCNRVRDRRFVWNGREHFLLLNSRDGRQTAHGFGWRTAWEVRARAYDTVHLRHDHIAGAWPWDYSADQRITLDAGGLTIALCVTNHSADTMPAGLGLHPYFPLSSRSRVAFCARTVEAVDRSGFPVPDPEGLMILSDAADGRLDPHIGNRYIGGVIGDVRIGDPTEPHAVILRASGCSTLALHVEQDSRLFCLEPMSHAIGALNASDPPSSGIRTLRPGERMSLTVRMDVASVW